MIDSQNRYFCQKIKKQYILSEMAKNDSDYFVKYKQLEIEYTALLNKYVEIEKSLKRYNLCPTDLLSVEKLNQFLYKNKSSDVIWLMDLKGKSTYVSSSIQKFTGFTEKEYLSQTIQERFMPESAQKAMNALMVESEVFKKNINTNSNAQFVIELEYRCKDGSTKWGELNITPVFDEEGNFVALNGITKDISEQIRNKVLISQQENHFLKMMELMPVFMFIHQNGKIVYANSAGRKELKITDFQDESIDIWSKINPIYLPIVKDNLEKRIRGEEVDDYQIEVINSSGKYVPVVVRALKMNYQFKSSILILISPI